MADYLYTVAFLDEGTGTDMLGEVTSVLGENIGEIVIIVGGLAGVFLVWSWIKRAIHRRS